MSTSEISDVANIVFIGGTWSAKEGKLMELQVSAMSDRQRKFRATYRQQIATWYNGWLHVAVIFISGFAVIYVCASNLRDVAWWMWGAVPAVFLT